MYVQSTMFIAARRHCTNKFSIELQLHRYSRIQRLRVHSPQAKHSKMAQSISVPSWVNAANLADVLKTIFENFESVWSFDTLRALDNGENYITSIVRICTKFALRDANCQRVQFILKIPLPQSGNESNATEHEYHELFVTEADMYTNIIPELEQLFSDVGQHLQFKPKHFRFPHEIDCDYILMEDLQWRNFANVDRRAGLDAEHTEAALTKLAQWHAASARRVEIKGDYPKEYLNSYFDSENIEMISKMNNAFNAPFKRCLERFDLLVEEQKAILQYMNNMNDLYLKFGQVDDKAFNVLNHGDFWSNNVMFQHDADTSSRAVKEVLFVDFQLPKYGSPAMDLFCFLMTSPEWSIKLPCFDYFIQHYHTQLLKHLQILRYEKPLPTLEALQVQLEKCGLWAFVCVQRMLAIVLLGPQENSNIDTFMSDNQEGIAFKMRMFLNPVYVQQVKNILPWLFGKKYLKL